MVSTDSKVENTHFLGLQRKNGLTPDFGNWFCLFVLFCFVFVFVFFVFCFLGLHPWPVEVPRLGVEWELQLPAYATATTMQDPSHVCDLHPSSRQHQIPDPLSEARDRT